MSTGFRAAAPQAAERAERAWVKGLGLAQHGQWHDAVTCFDQAHTEQPGDVLYFKKPELARLSINDVPARIQRTEGK
jgi:hypothetical protein